MNGQNIKIFSPQAADIYRLLQDKNSLSAKEIANELHIFPNAVYRAVKQLLISGFIQEESIYPVKYGITSKSNALDLYTNAFRKQFQQTFPGTLKNEKAKPIDMSFVNGRDDLQEKTNNDVDNAKNTVDFIVSGLEVRAETILIYKNAIDRGVTIRVLVQRLDDTSEEMFRNWKRIGLKVKYYPNMEARTFLID